MSKDKEAVKNLFNNLKSKIEQPLETPTQKVVTSKKSMLDDEAPFTLHLPKNRLKMLRIKAAEEETSIKDLINSAIAKQYGF